MPERAPRGYPDLAGERFGAWTVIEPFDWSAQPGKWLARCACGTERAFTDVTLHCWVRWKPSCGCLRPAPGRVYGCFTVLHRMGQRHGVPITDEKYPFWDCVCTCGIIWHLSELQLAGEPFPACPHKGPEFGACRLRPPQWKRRKVRRNRTEREVLRSIWKGMKRRCFESGSHSYQHYGGRGITICERWLDFECFAEDMGPRPAAELTLDRIDTNGNYEPTNCRWATRKQQANNKRTNRFMKVGTRRHTMAEWAEILKMPDATLRRTVARANTLGYGEA